MNDGRQMLSTTVAATLVVVCTAWGCGPGESDPGGSDATSGDTTIQDTDQNEMDTETAGDDTSNGLELGDVGGDRPPISNFEYRKRTTNCQNDCVSAISVSKLGGDDPDIQRVDNASVTEELDVSDAEDLVNNYLTEMVRKKMQNGWKCGSENSHDGNIHIFEYTPPGFNKDEVSRTVSGCIPDDSTEPDAELVQKIEGKLQDLRSKYFSN